MKLTEPVLSQQAKITASGPVLQKSSSNYQDEIGSIEQNQSFINLIYPSKSKKVLAGNASNIDAHSMAQRSPSGKVLQKPSHQKSKSHFIGNNDNKYSIQKVH